MEEIDKKKILVAGIGVAVAIAAVASIIYHMKNAAPRAKIKILTD